MATKAVTVLELDGLVGAFLWAEQSSAITLQAITIRPITIQAITIQPITVWAITSWAPAVRCVSRSRAVQMPRARPSLPTCAPVRSRGVQRPTTGRHLQRRPGVQPSSTAAGGLAAADLDDTRGHNYIGHIGLDTVSILKAVTIYAVTL